MHAVKDPAASNKASNLKRPSQQSPNARKQSLGSLLAGIGGCIANLQA